MIILLTVIGIGFLGISIYQEFWKEDLPASISNSVWGFGILVLTKLGGLGGLG